jgi:ABC-type antimicrobial peptide transport system, permease component
MPKAFRHPYRASLWLPLALEPDNPATINNHYLYGVARLRPRRHAGKSGRSCEAHVRHHQSRRSESGERACRLHPAVARKFCDGFAAENSSHRRGCSLCAVDRGGELRWSAARPRDRAGRGICLARALGASRRRLVRQQLIQALLLALAGTALGLLIAFWITPMLFALSPEGADATGSAMREFDYAARLDLPVFALLPV